MAPLVGTLAAERPVAIVIATSVVDETRQPLRFLRSGSTPGPLARVLKLVVFELDAPATRLCRVLRAKAHADGSRLGR